MSKPLPLPLKDTRQFPVHMEIGDIWGNTRDKFLVLDRWEQGEELPQWAKDYFQPYSDPRLTRYLYYLQHLNSGQTVGAKSNDKVYDGEKLLRDEGLTIPADERAHGRTISHPKGYSKKTRSLWKQA